MAPNIIVNVTPTPQSCPEQKIHVVLKDKIVYRDKKCPVLHKPVALSPVSKDDCTMSKSDYLALKTYPDYELPPAATDKKPSLGLVINHYRTTLHEAVTALRKLEDTNKGIVNRVKCN